MTEIERHPITNRDEWLQLRQRDVTASAAGAVLGVHEYMTMYSLWALKSGKILADPEETPPMIRGRLLEPVALQLLREMRPDWEITQPNTYYRDTGARIGATPDAIAIDPDRSGFGVLQVKCIEPTVYRKKWLLSGTAEPPLWIAVQALVEADLTGASWAAVAALRVGFGLDLDIIDVPIHRQLMDRLRTEVEIFWSAVEFGPPPDPDLGRDGALIESMYAPNGEVLDLSGDNYVMGIVGERELLSADKRTTEKRLTELKTELLVKLDGASAARLSDGRLITINRVKRKGYTVKDSEYLDLRVRKAMEIRA